MSLEQETWDALLVGREWMRVELEGANSKFHLDDSSEYTRGEGNSHRYRSNVGCHLECPSRTKYGGDRSMEC